MLSLDTFLDTISPQTTIEETGSRINSAVNSFVSDVAKVENWKEYEDVLAAYYCHLENHILRLDPPRVPDRQMDFGRSLHILRKEYGPNGDMVAYNLSKLGVEGGLPGVLRTIARHLEEQYARTEIEVRVASFIQSLSADQLLAYSQEYAQQYQHILPPEYADSSHVDVSINFWKILLEHPRALQRFGQTGR